MKYIALIAIALLSGCASLDYAGSSRYQIRQIIDQNGKTGFDILVKNGKEVALVKAHLEKKGEDFTIDLEEQGVTAFAGQAISAEALKMTVSETAKAVTEATLAAMLPSAIPGVAGILKEGGVGAGVLGAGFGAAGVLGAQRALGPKPAVTP